MRGSSSMCASTPYPRSKGGPGYRCGRPSCQLDRPTVSAIAAPRSEPGRSARVQSQKIPLPQEYPMGLFTKDIATMDDLLLHGLKDIYYAENQIIKSLPKLIEKATNRDLTKGLKDHLEETKNQVARL